MYIPTIVTLVHIISIPYTNVSITQDVKVYCDNLECEYKEIELNASNDVGYYVCEDRF